MDRDGGVGNISLGSIMALCTADSTLLCLSPNLVFFPIPVLTSSSSRETTLFDYN